MSAAKYPDVIGWPWQRAEPLLRDMGLSYQTELVRPTKHFFPTDEKQLYVVRGRYAPDGTLKLTLAAKALKGPEPEIRTKRKE